MVTRRVNIISGLIAIATLIIFTVGLSKSISSGFAGFKGGLPFAIIVAFVLCLAAYDFYDSCIRQPKNRVRGTSDRSTSDRSTSGTD